MQSVHPTTFLNKMEDSERDVKELDGFVIQLKSN